MTGKRVDLPLGSLNQLALGHKLTPEQKQRLGIGVAGRKRQARRSARAQRDLAKLVKLSA